MINAESEVGKKKGWWRRKWTSASTPLQRESSEGARRCNDDWLDGSQERKNYGRPRSAATRALEEPKNLAAARGGRGFIKRKTKCAQGPRFAQTGRVIPECAPGTPIEKEAVARNPTAEGKLGAAFSTRHIGERDAVGRRDRFPPMQGPAMRQISRPRATYRSMSTMWTYGEKQNEHRGFWSRLFSLGRNCCFLRLRSCHGKRQHQALAFRASRSGDTGPGGMRGKARAEISGCLLMGRPH